MSSKQRNHIPEPTPLPALRPGDQATIVRLEDGDVGISRLRDLGLSHGAKVRLVKYAPLGDPLEIEVRGFHLSVRKTLGQHIWVSSFKGP